MDGHIYGFLFAPVDPRPQELNSVGRYVQPKLIVHAGTTVSSNKDTDAAENGLAEAPCDPFLVWVWPQCVGGLK